MLLFLLPKKRKQQRNVRIKPSSWGQDCPRGQRRDRSQTLLLLWRARPPPSVRLLELAVCPTSLSSLRKRIWDVHKNGSFHKNEQILLTELRRSCVQMGQGSGRPTITAGPPSSSVVFRDSRQHLLFSDRVHRYMLVTTTTVLPYLGKRLFIMVCNLCTDSYKSWF